MAGRTHETRAAGQRSGVAAGGRRFNSALLRTLRLDTGYTQEALAEKLGVDVATVKNYESGRVNNPSFEVNRPARYNILYLMTQEFGLDSHEALILVDEAETAPISPSQPGLSSRSDMELPPPGPIGPPLGQAKTAPARRKALLLWGGGSGPEGVLPILQNALEQCGFEVAIPGSRGAGEQPQQDLDLTLRETALVIPLITHSSIDDVRFQYAVQVACQARRQQGHPQIVPCRIHWFGPLPAVLQSELRDLPIIVWGEDNQTPEMLAFLVRQHVSSPQDVAVTGRSLPPVGGALPLESGFYILRPVDDALLAALDRNDAIILIKGARQTGKTSLMARGLHQGRVLGKRIVTTDLQLLSTRQLESMDALFLAFAECFEDQLELDVSPRSVWKADYGPGSNFDRYLRRHVLNRLEGSVLWGLDEVDRLFVRDYHSEVFGIFRSLYNARSLNPAGLWNRLSIVMVHATEPHLFVADLNQSPFNVGTRLQVDDFSPTMVAELNRRYGEPLKWKDFDAFFQLVGGHPYLVQRGLHFLATEGCAFDELDSQADHDEGPFGDHLQRLLISLAKDTGLQAGVLEVLAGSTQLPPENFFRLRTAGLLRGDSTTGAQFRCEVYRRFLSQRIH